MAEAGIRDVYRPQAYAIFLIPAIGIFFLAHIWLPWFIALLIAVIGYMAIAYIIVIVGAVVGAVL